MTFVPDCRAAISSTNAIYLAVIYCRSSPRCMSKLFHI